MVIEQLKQLKQLNQEKIQNQRTVSDELVLDFYLVASVTFIMIKHTFSLLLPRHVLHLF